MMSVRKLNGRDYRVVQVFESDAYDVTLWASCDDGLAVYGVTYGKAEWWGLVYTNAATRLGEAMMHAANCQGLLD